MNPFAQFLLKDFSGKLLFVHFLLHITMLLWGHETCNRLIDGLDCLSVYSMVFNSRKRGFIAVIIRNYLLGTYLECKT